MLCVNEYFLKYLYKKNQTFYTVSSNSFLLFIVNFGNYLLLFSAN